MVFASLECSSTSSAIYSRPDAAIRQGANLQVSPEQTSVVAFAHPPRLRVTKMKATAAAAYEHRWSRESMVYIEGVGRMLDWMEVGRTGS